MHEMLDDMQEMFHCMQEMLHCIHAMEGGIHYRDVPRVFLHREMGVRSYRTCAAPGPRGRGVDRGPRDGATRSGEGLQLNTWMLDVQC
jgi:hypothetical protein